MQRRTEFVSLLFVWCSLIFNYIDSSRCSTSFSVGSESLESSGWFISGRERIIKFVLSSRSYSSSIDSTNISSLLCCTHKSARFLNLVLSWSSCRPAVGLTKSSQLKTLEVFFCACESVWFSKSLNMLQINYNTSDMTNTGEIFSLASF